MLTYAAPMRIAGEEAIAAVQVKSDANMQRMWVHQVVLKEKLRGASNEGTGARAEAEKRTGSSPGALERLLRDIYAVNPDQVSQVVDENGEPLVVYHGTGEGFEAIRLGDEGVYFIDDSGYAAATPRRRRKPCRHFCRCVALRRSTSAPETGCFMMRCALGV